MICGTLCKLYKTFWWNDVKILSKSVLDLYANASEEYKSLIEKELQQYS